MFYIFTLFIVFSILYYKNIFGKNEEIIENLGKSIKEYNYKLEIPKINTLILSTSEKNNPYYIFGLELSKYFPLELKTSNGSLDNINSLINRETDICLCQEDIFYDIYNGKNEFPFRSDNLRFISGLFYELCTFIAQSDTTISTFTDLLKPNKFIIGLPDKSSGSFRIFKLLLEFLNIELVEYDSNDTELYYKKIRYITAPINDLIEMFYDDKISGLFLVTTSKNIYLINLCKIMVVKFIPIQLNIKNMKSKLYPIFNKNINTSDYYISIHNSEKISTIAVRSILVTRENVNNNYIYHVTKTLFNNHLSLRNKINSFLFSQYYHNYLEDAFVPSQMFYIDKEIPIHEGSLKYYKESGYISYNDVSEDNNILCNETVCKKYEPIKYYWKYKISDLNQDSNYLSHLFKL